jgi:hypothetical protein
MAVTNRHGDRYPPGANNPDALPPRVTRRDLRSPMTGIVTIDGREMGELGATRHDPWAEQARERMTALGILPYVIDALYNHVEVKVVMAMIAMGARHGEVTINNSPCGSQPYPPFGCHQQLAELLPAGRTLTVYGTTADGEPFERTYRGKATQ